MTRAPLAPPASRQELIEEIQRLTTASQVVSHSRYTVFRVCLDELPVIKHELGYLREKTYREIGEGSFTQLDLDHYDEFYDQFLIWDKKEEELIGGYRVGNGKKIMEEQGVGGFYSSSLLQYHEDFFPYLEKSIELGRSFIIKKHQQQPFPLFLIWKAMYNAIESHYQNKFVIGCMSISPLYSTQFVDLILAYLQEHHWNEELSGMVRPTQPWVSNMPSENSFASLAELEAYAKSSFAQPNDIPVLLKKYLNQNAKALCFNRDLQFGNCLDVFMMLNMQDLPRSTKEKLNV